MFRKRDVQTVQRCAEISQCAKHNTVDLGLGFYVLCGHLVVRKGSIVISCSTYKTAVSPDAGFTSGSATDSTWTSDLFYFREIISSTLITLFHRQGPLWVSYINYHIEKNSE